MCFQFLHKFQDPNLLSTSKEFTSECHFSSTFSPLSISHNQISSASGQRIRPQTQLQHAFLFANQLLPKSTFECEFTVSFAPGLEGREVHNNGWCLTPWKEQIIPHLRNKSCLFSNYYYLWYMSTQKSQARQFFSWKIKKERYSESEPEKDHASYLFQIKGTHKAISLRTRGHAQKLDLDINKHMPSLWCVR